MKKLISFLICLLLLANTVGCGAATDPSAIPPPVPLLDGSMYLRDIAGHWARDTITQCAAMGIVKGDENQNMNPDDDITRAEFVAMLIRALYVIPYINNPARPFSDVAPSDWFFPPVTVAKTNGILAGADTDAFSPNTAITREDMMIFTVRALDPGGEPPDHTVKLPSDIKAGYAYLDQLKYALANGIITGYPDGAFKPQGAATRAETTVIILRAMQQTATAAQNGADQTPAAVAAAQTYLTGCISAKSNPKAAWDDLISDTAGKENYLNALRKRLYAYTADQGMTVTQKISNISAPAVSLINPAQTRVEFDYTSDFTRRFSGQQREKSYLTHAAVSLEWRAGQWVVYEMDQTLKYKQPFTLVWEQIYMPGYTMAGVDKIDGLDVLSPMWYGVSGKPANGTQIADGLYFSDLSTPELNRSAKNNGYDIWAMFKGENDSPAWAAGFLTSEDEKSQTLAWLLRGVFQTAIDGVNIDFEDIDPANRDDLSQFIRQTGFLLDEFGIISSADVTKYYPQGGPWSLCYDRAEIGRTMDYVCLMAYDQTNGGSKVAGSVADLPWTEGCITLTLPEVPAEKLVLGVPFYTRVFREQKGAVLADAAITMDNANQRMADAGIKPVFDPATGQNYAKWSDGTYTREMWIEDATSMTARLNLMKQYNLAGIAAWSRMQGNPEIWKTIKGFMDGMRKG